MAFVLTSPPSSSSSSLLLVSHPHQFSTGIKSSQLSFRPQLIPTRSRILVPKPSCFNLPQDPILSDALKEPVAFLGGMFAGLLRLDMDDEPLKEWVTRTVEASGIAEEVVGVNGMVSNEEDSPQQIEIE